MNIMHPKTDANNSESIPSSIEYSKSSDAIDTTGDDKITNAINKEVDKVLRPILERTSSGCDLKIIAPLRHKRREYRSQEVLPNDETLIASPSHNTLPNQSEVEINNLHDSNKLKVPRVSILHENQRAEIIASVTERLYSKLKKKEVSVSKMESLVDRKIVEPLSELKICTNARQRLIELSHKALRNKRKVGIPAYTQTKISVIRVKDQGIDVQSDLEAYSIKNDYFYTCKRDASTETLPMTPRYKEIGIGPKYGSLNSSDRSTITDVKQAYYKNSYMMTDPTVKNDRLTQTRVIPPPRRRKRGLKKGFNTNNDHSSPDEISSGPVISINISQTYPIDSGSQSSEDNFIQVVNNSNIGNITKTPDLLTDHTPDTNENDVEPISNNDFNQAKESRDNDITVITPASLGLKQDNEDFSDHEDYSLPRVIPDSLRKNSRSDMKEMILGRNKNMYPYNIVLSPSKQQEHCKRIVTFGDYDPENRVVVQRPYNDENNINVPKKACFPSEQNLTEKYFSDDINPSESASLIDSIESEKVETDSLNWKKEVSDNKTLGCRGRKNYVPVYRSNPRYKTAKEFLGFENIDHAPKNIVNRNYQTKEIMSSDNTDKYDGSEYFTKIKLKNQSSVKRRNYQKDDEFESIERKIFNVCNDLELSVNKYNNYIETCSNKFGHKNDTLLRTPTKYLQHLIHLRREMVKMEQVSNKPPFADPQSNFS